MCVCISLCTIVVHITAQNSPNNHPSCPPDSHQCSDVHWRGILDKKIIIIFLIISNKFLTCQLRSERQHITRSTVHYVSRTIHQIVKNYFSYHKSCSTQSTTQQIGKLQQETLCPDSSIIQWLAVLMTTHINHLQSTIEQKRTDKTVNSPAMSHNWILMIVLLSQLMTFMAKSTPILAQLRRNN